MIKNKVKDFRTALGVSQKEVGKALGRSPLTISHWESQKGQPNLKNVLAMLKYFKCDFTDLIYETDDQTRTEQPVAGTAEPVEVLAGEGVVITNSEPLPPQPEAIVTTPMDNPAQQG
jgi:DNA-binding XRE family transcriptional regulator